MNDLVLSIIVPVYNSAAYLPAYLKSMESAGKPEWELILVDDGSTDGSLDICQAYARSHSNVYVYSRQNQGPSAARNYGMRMARGEYITFHDSDDVIDPELFGQAADYALRSAADLFATDFHRVSDDGIILDRVYQIPETACPVWGEDYEKHFVTSGDCVWNVWRYFYRRTFLENGNLYFREGFHCGEDLEFVVRVLTQAERIMFFHCPYYSYRVNYGDTLTRKYDLARVSQLMQMLLAGQNALAGQKTVLANGLQAMLSREYFLNLPLFLQVPANERSEALSELKRASILLTGAAGVYQKAAVFVRLLGIPFCAWALLIMKKGKRGLRAYRERKERNKGIRGHSGL